MIAAGSSCTVVQERIDTPHLLFQMQMQSLIRSGFDGPETDNKIRGFLEFVA